MASLQFQERFKDRLGAIGKLGDIGMPSSCPVHVHPTSATQGSTQTPPFMPAPKQHPVKDSSIFVRPIRINGLSISDTESTVSRQVSDAESVRIQPKHKLVKSMDSSALPIVIGNLEEMRQGRGGQGSQPRKRPYIGQSRSIDFTPYTLSDYRRKKSTKYYVLGGIGPFMIGSEVWKQRMEQQRRRVEYGAQVMKSKGPEERQSKRETSSSPARV